MEMHSMHFKAQARAALADTRLQENLGRVKSKLTDLRAVALSELEDLEATREAASELRDRTLADLDLWLEHFEREAIRRGATVLWAKDGAEACARVVDIARRHGVKTVAKSKSMLTEEVGLNQALRAVGITPVETDLGEYILQINDDEPPSHIIVPAFHKSRAEISALFARIHGRAPKSDIGELTREAREVLRSHFLSADMGVTGGNFLVAETGSVVLVTNEGNGRMVTTLPRVHVAVTGIEKVVPTLEDVATLLRLLPRSATGQSITNYVSLLTGKRRTEGRDGPEHMYIVLVDNGRADLVGGEFGEMLRCIRCGACMNHCPVYQTIGGQAYGWVYPGPMGSVLTPLLAGIEKATDLPQAATLCGQCAVVCPVKIPLPELLRRLRERQLERRLRPMGERLALKAWAFAARHPALYALGAKLLVRHLRWLAGREDSIRVLGLAPGWTRQRDFPAPEGRTFRELYARRH